MSEYGLEKTIELHSQFRDRFKELCGSSDFVDRIASSIAVILVGAYTLEKVFNLGMRLDKLAKYFAKNIQGVADTLDMADTAYERICEVVQSNEKKFIHYVKRQSSDEEGHECWGRIIDCDSMSPKTKNNCPDVVAQIEILHDRFFKIVKDLGYSDVDIVINKLKHSGYLYYEKEKHYRKRKLRKTDTKASHVIVLNVFNEEGEDEIFSKGKPVRPTIKRAQHTHNCDVDIDTPMDENNDNLDDWDLDWEEDED